MDSKSHFLVNLSSYFRSQLKHLRLSILIMVLVLPVITLGVMIRSNSLLIKATSAKSDQCQIRGQVSNSTAKKSEEGISRYFTSLKAGLAYVFQSSCTFNCTATVPAEGMVGSEVQLGSTGNPTGCSTSSITAIRLQ